MEYLALIVMAAISHTGSARSWRWQHNYPEKKHHNFDYNSWCHSAGGWPGHTDSWEDHSWESETWNDNRWTRSTTKTKLTTVTTKLQTRDTSTISIRAGADSPSPLELRLCLGQCPITPEYNPVCGTDDITYWNPGRLQCAISCGVEVGLRRPSICPTSDLQSSASTSSTSVTPSPQTVAICMRSCPVTSEYNPICGTDNVTYSNPSRLECAKSCGKPVSQRLASRCPPPEPIGTSSTSSSTTTTTTTTTTARPNSSVSPNSESRSSTEYTIDPDILNAVFNGNNSTSTTEYIPDFSLDERYEDGIDSHI